MLPQLFLDRMKQMLEEEYPAFLNSYEDARYQALRINPSKTDTDRFTEETSFHLQPVPWEANGFYYEKEDQPGKHPYHEAGVYYIQEPSAMEPAAYLNISLFTRSKNFWIYVRHRGAKVHRLRQRCREKGSLSAMRFIRRGQRFFPRIWNGWV